MKNLVKGTSLKISVLCDGRLFSGKLLKYSRTKFNVLDKSLLWLRESLIKHSRHNGFLGGH